MAWSPDGAKFAIFGVAALYSADSQGGAPEKLVDQGGYGGLDWTKWSATGGGSVGRGAASPRGPTRGDLRGELVGRAVVGEDLGGVAHLLAGGYLRVHAQRGLVRGQVPRRLEPRELRRARAHHHPDRVAAGSEPGFDQTDRVEDHDGRAAGGDARLDRGPHPGVEDRFELFQRGRIGHHQVPEAAPVDRPVAAQQVRAEARGDRRVSAVPAA